jgi:hypothetical protein
VKFIQARLPIPYQIVAKARQFMIVVEKTEENREFQSLRALSDLQTIN